MTKMNWEKRNKMQKVYDNRPQWPSKKRKGKKGNTRPKRKLDSYQGFVKLKSKYNSKCDDCYRPFSIGDIIWWWPEGKLVVHDACFEELIKE